MFSGAFLEDAIVVSCGHSFGGLMLRRVLEMVGVCFLMLVPCDGSSTYPRLFHNHGYLLHSLDVRSAMQKSSLGLWSLTMVIPIKLHSLIIQQCSQTILTVLFNVKHPALRAAASAIKQQDDKRLFHNAAMRRRRKEMSDQMDVVR